MSHKPKKKNPSPGPAPLPKRELAAAAPGGRGAGVLAIADDFEPEAEAGAVPVWLFVLLLVLVYWGMIHLDNHAGGFNKFVYGPFQSYKQLADLAPKSGPEMLIAKGEAIYGTVCIACHQATGLGSPGQYPPLAGSEWVQGSSNRVVRIPLQGLTGNIEVKGQTINGSMPAFGTTPPMDNDENVAAVLTYIRQAWGNKAPPISPEQVKAVRAETASRTSQWTPEELLKIE
jgi:mono/diheme cytochrome c family protein